MRASGVCPVLGDYLAEGDASLGILRTGYRTI